MLNDFERLPTIDERCVSWFHIALINIGSGVCLPMFFIASTIVLSVGFKNAVLAFIFGSIFLSFISAWIGYVGAKSRVSTYVLVNRVFGKCLSKLVNTLIALTFVGWLSVSLNFFGEIMGAFMLKQFALNYHINVWITFGGLLALSSAIFGFKGIDMMSIVFVPLLLIILYSMIYPALELRTFNDIWNDIGSGSMRLGEAMSLAIGSFIVGATTMSDTTRYCRTGKDGIYGCIAGFIFGQFFVFLPCAIVAVAFQNADFISIVVSYSSMIALIILMTTMWTNNDNNLYQAALSFSIVFYNIKRVYLTIIVVIFGTLLAYMKFVKIIIPFLELLSITIPSIAGILVVDYFINKKHTDIINANIKAICSWALGVLIGFSTCYGFFTITTIPAIDGAIVGVMAYILSFKIQLPRFISKKNFI